MRQKMGQNQEDWRKYRDLLELSHPVSATHPRMSIHDRAAQFAPFAALTGYGDAVRETERLTEAWVNLDEDRKAELDAKLGLLRVWMKEPLEQRPEVSVIYFQADERKDGGEYVTAVGRVKKIDEVEGLLVLEEGTDIAVSEIVEVSWM